MSPFLDPHITANQQHVPPPGRADAIAGQVFGNRTVTGAQGHMLKDRKWNLRQQDKISKPLKGLELRQKADTRSRLPGSFFRPDQLHKVRRVHIVELFG